MKRFSWRVLVSAALLIAAALIVPVWGMTAEADTWEDWEFYPNGAGCTVTNYTGSETELEIPRVVGGYLVSVVGSGAFRNRTDLTSVTMPDSVIIIEESAFEGCANMTSCPIPDGMLIIGDRAFYGCSSLTSVTIPAGVTSIGEYAFYTCYNLTGIEIPVGVTSIGNYAFSNCDSLTSIEIPESVTSIGNYAFAWCVGATSVEIPVGVTSIGQYAFYDCYNLTSVKIPSGVTSIDNNVFCNCSSLTSVEIPESVTSIGNYAFAWCESLRSVEIPSGVTSIGEYAFYYSIHLAGITIPNGVTSIGGYTFCGCRGLTSVAIPESVTSIGDYAFYGCSGLTTLGLSENVASIGDTAFNECSNLFISAPESSYAYQWADEHGLLPENAVLESQHPYANYADENWTYEYPGEAFGLKVTFSWRTRFENGSDWLTVTNINGEQRQYTGSKLSGATILVPGNSFGLRFTSDGDLFYYGFSITSIEPVSEEEYEEYSQLNLYTTNILSDDTLEITGYYGWENEIAIPGEINGIAVTGIGENAFHYFTNLTGITIPDSVTSIGNYAFFNCSGLTSVTIPNGVTSIGRYTFCGCRGLTSVAIPESVTSIGDYAFYGCSGLTTLGLSENVAWIGETAFIDCPNLIITAPEGSYAHQWAVEHELVPENAVLESAHPYAEGSEGTWTYTHPTEAYALRVTFSKKTNVGYNCDFRITDQNGRERRYTATQLAGGTILTLGNAFEVTLRAASWESYFGFRITAVEAVTEAEYKAECEFEVVNGALIKYNGTATEVTVPANWNGQEITAIGRSAFEYADVESVVISEGITFIDVFAFRDCANLRSVSIPDGVTTIREYAFMDCVQLTGIELPNSLTYMSHGVFVGCERLTAVNIPNSLSGIQPDTFAGCTSLTEITIPAAVSLLSGDAFNGCSSLTAINVDPENAAYCSIDGVVYNKAATNLVVYPRGKQGAFVIPAGVTDISYGAFTTCIGLTSVELPDGLTSIGDAAFNDCTGLTGVTIPEGVTSIGGSAFSGCNSLTSVTIPEGVTSIGSYAFYNCSGLKSITIPDSLTSIGGSAFENCRGLTSVTIPEGVTSIGGYAFYNCSGLKSITIPDSLTSIGGYAFGNCINLTDVYFRGTEAQWNEIAIDSGNNYLANAAIHYGSDGPNTWEDWEFYPNGAGCTVTNYTGSETELEIPRVVGGYLVSVVGSGAFRNRTDLTSVTMPDSVIIIEESAFEGCTNMTSCPIPNGMLIIGDRAFYGCTNLTALELSENVASIGDTAFDNCPRLLITASENSYAYRWAGDHGFLPENAVLESAHPYANDADETWSYTYPGEAFGLKVTFSKRTQLESEYDWLTVTSGSVQKTYSGRELSGETILLPGNSFELRLTSDEIVACFGFRITSIEPVSEEEYEEYLRLHMFNTYALSDGTLMITGYNGWEAEITIPGEINGTAVTVIGESAFDGCGILTSVTIPESVTDIRGFAFFRCSNLASVVIPGSVTIIGERAFYDCDSLTSIAIPAGVTEIGNSAFRYCDSLTEIQVDGNNPYYASVGGVLFNKSVTDLITCPAGYEGSYSIPMGVTSIGDNAFDGCGSLTGVTIPDSVTNIGWAAFYRCTSLTGIQVDGNNPSYASVGGVLFNKSRTSLIVCPAGFEGSYSIPMGVTSINTSAFGFCNSLTGVTIPASVTGISWDAFVNCWALTDVYYTGSEEQWNAMNILDGNDALIDATIHFNYVPEQVFTAVLTLPASLTEIEEEAFAGLTNIEMVVLPDTCMTIGARAFAGCTNLQVVVMPEGVSIGDGAFDGCPYVRFISGGDDDIAE